MTSQSAMTIDPTLAHFLSTQVNSFVKWDLVRFFHQNPYATDSAESIARHTGREYHAIRSELDELVTTNVLATKEQSGQTLYRLSSDPDMRQLIASFVRACDDRTFRIQAIDYMVRGTK